MQCACFDTFLLVKSQRIAVARGLLRMLSPSCKRLMSHAPTAVPHHAMTSSSRVTRLHSTSRRHESATSSVTRRQLGSVATSVLRRKAAQRELSAKWPPPRAATMRTTELAVTTQHMVALVSLLCPSPNRRLTHDAISL
jgi:hypothetical protein